MTLTVPGLEQVQKFVELSQQSPLRSTGAALATLSSPVYNVDGSRDDPKHVPKHENEAWKQLLIGLGVSAASPCYVTNAVAPKDSSHPEFSVGGHMTTDATGEVPVGGTCYLMPLCNWHNNKARDGVKFEHVLTQVVKLTGYMKGELAATFQLRLPTDDPFAVLYYAGADQGWKYRNFVQDPSEQLEQAFPGETPPDLFVVIERSGGPQVTHAVRDVRLP